MTVTTTVAVAALVGAGVWLLFDRDRARTVLGAGLLGHGVVLLVVLQGRPGDAPLVGTGTTASRSDAVPQALALTAIVIGFGVAAYLLALLRAAGDEGHDLELADETAGDAPEAEPHATIRETTG